MKLNTQLKAASIAVITTLGLTACGGGSGTPVETLATPQYYVVTEVEFDSSNSDIEGIYVNDIIDNADIARLFRDYEGLGEIDITPRSAAGNHEAEWSQLSNDDPEKFIDYITRYQYDDASPLNGSIDRSPVSYTIEDGKLTSFNFNSGSDFGQLRLFYNSDGKLNQVDAYDNQGQFEARVFSFSYDANGKLIKEARYLGTTARLYTYEYGTPSSGDNTSTRIVRRYDNVTYDVNSYALDENTGNFARKEYEEYDSSSRLVLSLVDFDTDSDDSNGTNDINDSATEYEGGELWSYNQNGLIEYREYSGLQTTPEKVSWEYTYSTVGDFIKVASTVTDITGGTWNDTTFEFTGGTGTPEHRENNYIDANKNLAAVEYLNDTTGITEDMVIFSYDGENRVVSTKYYESGTANASDFNFLDNDNAVNDSSAWNPDQSYTNRYYEEKPSCEVIYENTTVSAPTECLQEPTPDEEIISDSPIGVG